jgi:hypothetical protein
MPVLSIAKGELWLRDGDTAPVALTSPFAKEVIERDAQSRRNTGWKHAPREEQSGVIPNSALWGQRGAGPKVMAPPRFLFACAGAEPRTLYYVLSVGGSTGLFRQQLDEQREVRLFHRSQLPCGGFVFNRHDRRIVLASGNPDGTMHLEVYDEEGNRKGDITSGDCVDAAPSLVPGPATELVYQSAGVARHPQHGHTVAVGHSTVNRLDYKSGELATLLEDERYDFVAPKVHPDGTLYAIRRPVDKPAAERAGSALKDTLLLPFRLAKAVFGYLNFFSMVYGKEPLRSAGGPRTPELDQDLGKLWLHGRMIELSKVRNDPTYAGNLVPRSWELVRKPPGRALQIVLPHVASFDISADGAVVYTNGYDVMSWRDGERSRLDRHELIESVQMV